MLNDVMCFRPGGDLAYSKVTFLWRLLWLELNLTRPLSTPSLLKAQISITKAAQEKAKTKKVVGWVRWEGKNGKSDKRKVPVAAACCRQGKDDDINFVSDLCDSHTHLRRLIPFVCPTGLPWPCSWITLLIQVNPVFFLYSSPRISFHAYY